MIQENEHVTSGMDEVAIKQPFVAYAVAGVVHGGAVARVVIAQLAMAA